MCAEFGYPCRIQRLLDDLARKDQVVVRVRVFAQCPNLIERIRFAFIAEGREKG